MNITKIKIGELFEVDNKLYLIILPISPNTEVNTHGHIVAEVHPI